jgi:peptidoglycan/LPS O-acetylase OafA/YrhL
MAYSVKKNNKLESGNLNVLRSIGVICVVVAHLRRFFGSDWLGPVNVSLFGLAAVLLFFVHTSLALLMSMERMHLSNANFIEAFYLRRAFRIYPLSIVCVLGYTVFQIPESPWMGFAKPTVGGSLANIGLIQNITSSPSIVGPLWSLPYEVQMCLLLPLLFVLITKRNSILLTSIILTGSIIAVVGELKLFGHADVLRYIPCFFGGIFAYQRIRTERDIISSRLWIPAILSVMVVFYLLTAQARSNHLSAVLGHPISWAFCIAFGFMLPLFSEMEWRPLLVAAHKIAKYSYGLYLTHCLSIWISFVVLRSRPQCVRWLSLAVLLVILPLAAYHLCEEPMIRFGRRISSGSRRPSALYCGAVVGQHSPL